MMRSFSLCHHLNYIMFQLCFILLVVEVTVGAPCIPNVTKLNFPDGFLFGASTSAYQVEGGYLEDGKSLSNWDVFSHIAGNVFNGDNGDIAADHYHRYMEDIEILHSLGVDAYRFSISWSRILPSGRFGDINKAGINFYNKIINELLVKGIQPFVTIHHFDLPQELEDRFGSWLSPLMQEEFVYFAEICFRYFGDRVKYWVTMNEPNAFAPLGYDKGLYPPAHRPPPSGNYSRGDYVIEPLIVVHNMLLAHAKATNLYRQRFQAIQGGSIGLASNAFMYIPLNELSKLDQDAASKAMIFDSGWIFDPMIFGDYPSEMHQYYCNEMPKFTAEEKMVIKDSIDFIGLNHYTTLYATHCNNSSDCEDTSSSRGFPVSPSIFTTGERDGVLIGEPTGISRFFVVPRGMESIVEYMKRRYHNKPIFITEHGYPSLVMDEQSEEFINDAKRIEFHKSYLAYLARVIRNGADVRGYFIWSLMDNFEWSAGYKFHFGLNYIHPLTLERIQRASSMWYREFLMENGHVLYNEA